MSRNFIRTERRYRSFPRSQRVSSPPPPSAGPTPSAPGSELRVHTERVLSAHYELDSEIGRGGMGVVYLAKDKRLKRQVAIKVLPPELAFQSGIKTRFLREAETAAQLSHPNIVPIYTVDEAEGLVFFVMAYVSGDNLAKRLHDSGVLPVDEVRRITREVADALAYAHERGVVHRDIKPDNILLDARTGRTMVTDFGIARAVSDIDSGRLTATGMAIGTPAYMSPEQAAGDREIDGRSDLYSLGIVSYQMLVGEPPFVASSTPAMLVKHISERPTPVSERRAGIPSDLARAVMMCLEKDPVGRFPTAGALVTALDTGNVPEPRRIEPSALAQMPQQSRALPQDYALNSDDRVPTPEEIRRFNAPEVVKFRQKLAPYLFVNGVILLAAIFTDRDLMFFTVMWSIYIAYKYARLWSEGFDWRDVFRQPRDKELMDVVDEATEYMRAMFNRDRRRELKERNRVRNAAARRSGALNLSPGSAERVMQGGFEVVGTHGDKVRAAAVDRDEIHRLVGSLPDRERQRVSDVTRSADALHDRIQALAVALADLERNSASGGGEALEAEILRLEEQANPLDAGSEERIRRLAYLKRQRRAVKDVSDRKNAVAAKLETCGIALRQMKLDVLRLMAGSQTHQHVTSLALEAMNLADSVDSALYVADEVSRVTERKSQRSARLG